MENDLLNNGAQDYRWRKQSLTNEGNYSLSEPVRYLRININFNYLEGADYRGMGFGRSKMEWPSFFKTSTHTHQKLMVKI